MISAHYFDTAKKGIVTTVAVCMTAYLFVILLTFSVNDPSWSHISSDMGQVSNMGGAVGAWLADVLYTFFGWSAWWLIVMVAYETINMWWHREKTHGALRLVSYVFFLLASCGFMTLLFQMFNVIQSTDSHFGGILGVEVGFRLANLLTQLGAIIFLIVFLIVSLTFAFNIHWKKVLGSASSLWQGNGVLEKKKESDHLDVANNMTSADDESLANNAIESSYKDDDEVELNVTEYKTSQSNKTSTQTSNQHSLLFDQLSLDLHNQSDNNEDNGSQYSDAEQQIDAHTDDRKTTFNNVLDEFLITSGITKSLLEMQQQETEQLQFDLKNQPDASTVYNQNLNQQVDSGSNHARKKKEPSFAWNDQSVIDSLLDEQALTIEVADSITTQQQPQMHQTTQTNSEPVHEAASRSEPLDSGILKSDDMALKVLDTTDNALKDDEQLADVEPLNQNNSSVAESIKHIKQTQAHSTATNGVSSTIQSGVTETGNHQSAPLIDSAIQPVSRTEANKEDEDVFNKSALNIVHENTSLNNETIDLTPTNTPPANPIKPFSNYEKQAENNKAAANQTNEGSKSKITTISFDTPDGDEGNFIEPMVPDAAHEDSTDNELTNVDLPEVSLPTIDDDAAFAHKSRSMQTAKYRDSLTPLPELSILDKPDPDRKPSYTDAELQQLSELLEIKLQDFNVKAEVKNAIPGPVVTRFEVELAAGVKASKVTGISRDLARSLSMATLRVVEVIPGKPYIGIEIPNKKRAMVRLIELLQTDMYKDPKAQISMAMGKDIGGKPIITDLAKAPHMLVAGTTGSGKSVLVNAMLLSMLLKYKPAELRLILIDPKQLELANYNDIPHLLTPVVTDMNEAASSLSWCVAEMERRYQLMSLLKVRKLNEFNKKVVAAKQSGNPIIDPLWRPNDSVSMDKAPKLKTLPMIVIVADEFADMIMQVGKQAEELITRLAQKSRAAGIHLMLATQRPSVDVITGLIKANIPVRAALRVNSKVDSRTILDAGGAEDMLGNGDMLFLGPGQIEPDRVHGAYVSDEEVNRVCDAWRERGAPDYIDNMASNFELTSPSSGGAGNTSGEDDKLYDEAVAFVMETRKVSASSIQRKFSIGYNRAARIVDSMEEAGLVSAMGKSGKRELLM